VICRPPQGGSDIHPANPRGDLDKLHGSRPNWNPLPVAASQNSPTHRQAQSANDAGVLIALKSKQRRRQRKLASNSQAFNNPILLFSLLKGQTKYVISGKIITNA
jgi:hypothetical protein